MTKRWDCELLRPDDDPDRGPAGSHMCPVVSFDGRGDTIPWGERCIGLDDGVQRWVADVGPYQGHTDIIHPTLDGRDGSWHVFTCRESDPKITRVSPRSPAMARRYGMMSIAGIRIWAGPPTSRTVRRSRR